MDGELQNRPFCQERICGNQASQKCGSLIPRIFGLLFIMLAINSIRLAAEDIPSIIVNQVRIPTGKQPEAVNWINFGENDWRKSIKGFLVDEKGDLYLAESTTGKIKVYASSGKYLRQLSDHGAYHIFIHGSTLYGIRRPNDKSDEELIAFDKNDGMLLYSIRLPFGEPLWTAFEMEDEKIYFSSEGIAKGKIIHFDTSNRRFAWNENYSQYQDSNFNKIKIELLRSGFEPIGRVGNGFFFRNVNFSDNNP